MISSNSRRNKLDIPQGVKRIIADVSDIYENNLLITSNLFELGIDSLEKVEILMSVENMFGVDFTDYECSSIETVEEIIELVAQKMSERNINDEKKSLLNLSSKKCNGRAKGST